MSFSTSSFVNPVASLFFATIVRWLGWVRDWCLREGTWPVPCWASLSGDWKGFEMSTDLALHLGWKANLLGIVNSASLDIFILAGQSNMAGRGGVVRGRWDQYVPPQCWPNRRISRLNAGRQWEEAHEPLHADIDAGKACGVGPGMAFANEVVRARGSDEVVGLVPCAVGGTRISAWARGTSLYSELVSRALESAKNGGSIRAVLWYQGESDTVIRADAEGYRANMERLVMDLRSDLKIPDLLVIQVVLASGEGKFTDVVRKAQLEINLPNVKCVDAKGLPLKADNLHLTTASEVRLGLMLAHAFLGS
ncbi:probable carbohydrate esterase At4g34215 [Morus notabilis]|uniref:probable carbohydrate esterase At4g34215 n=1 Tax=Morus notabilis TaxID=981085 RepID=UPI000CED3A3B|nr:probable carbohydrate esterase At4g34215 [Morus notabilis]